MTGNDSPVTSLHLPFVGPEFSQKDLIELKEKAFEPVRLFPRIIVLHYFPNTSTRNLNVHVMNLHLNLIRTCDKSEIKHAKSEADMRVKQLFRYKNNNIRKHNSLHSENQ